MPIDLPGRVQPFQQDLVELGPHPGCVPVSQSAPAGHARTTIHFLRQHLPGDAALEHEEDAGQDGAVVDTVDDQALKVEIAGDHCQAHFCGRDLHPDFSKSPGV